MFSFNIRYILYPISYPFFDDCIFKLIIFIGSCFVG